MVIRWRNVFHRIIENCDAWYHVIPLVPAATLEFINTNDKHKRSPLTILPWFEETILGSIIDHDAALHVVSCIRNFDQPPGVTEPSLLDASNIFLMSYNCSFCTILIPHKYAKHEVK